MFAFQMLFHVIFYQPTHSQEQIQKPLVALKQKYAVNVMSQPMASDLFRPFSSQQLPIGVYEHAFDILCVLERSPW